MSKMVGVLVSVALLGAGASLGAVEVTPFVGWGSKGFGLETGIVCVQQPCPTRAASDSSVLFGAVVNGPLAGGWSWEANLDHQPTRIALGSPERADLDQTRFQLGALRRWGAGSIQPFAVAGIGVTRLESDPLFVDGALSAISEDRVSSSLGGGVKLGLTDRVGLRLEARGYWTDLPASLGGSMFTVETTTGVSLSW